MTYRINSSKKAIGLLQAIMMILLVSGMMIIVLKYASISAKHTQNSFIREQAELFLNSAIEQTLLEISLHQRTNNNCLPSYSPKNLERRGITYSANIDIKKYYLQKDSDDLNICTDTTGIDVVSIGSGSGDSHGMVLLEIEVNATKESDTVARILRRTLQQP